MPLHGVSTADSLKAIEQLFKADIDPKRVAAIIFEPVQGEGGFNPAPPEFVRALRTLCDEHGILLIADEVQTGFARTGKLFAMEHYDVVPDLMTMAKSLAGGMPLSGVVGRAEVMDAPRPAASAARMPAIRWRSRRRRRCSTSSGKSGWSSGRTCSGQRLKDRLSELRKAVPQIADVRGPGDGRGRVLKPGTREADAEFTKRVQTRALARGLLLLSCGVYGNVVRFLFPLTISDVLMTKRLAILEAALRGS